MSLAESKSNHPVSIFSQSHLRHEIVKAMHRHEISPACDLSDSSLHTTSQAAGAHSLQPESLRCADTNRLLPPCRVRQRGY